MGTNTVIVTGASRGIGRAIATKLASKGWDIAAVCASGMDAAEELCEKCRAAGVRAKAYRCDVSDFSAAKQLVADVKADFGGLHALINNAGITRDGLMAMMSEEDFDKVIDINLKGAFNMIRHCIPLFMRNRQGCIINISSVSGLIGNAGQANYCASKAGLIGLTKAVAKEYAAKGVRCNAIAPGFISTDMTEGLPQDELLKAIPLGRMGQPEDVADAAAYLLSAKYVTGEVLRVDGGIAM